MNFNITGLGFFIASTLIAVKHLESKIQKVATQRIEAAASFAPSVTPSLTSTTELRALESSTPESLPKETNEVAAAPIIQNEVQSNFPEHEKATIKIQSVIRMHKPRSDFLESKKTTKLLKTEMLLKKGKIQSGHSTESLKKSLGLNTWKSSGNKEEAAKRIIECFQKRSKNLDLRNLSLNSFPEKILSYLHLLKELYLSGNNITCINLKDSNLEKIYLDRHPIDLLIQDGIKISTPGKDTTSFGLEQLITFSPKKKQQALALIQEHIDKKIDMSEEEDKTREEHRKKEEKLIEKKAKIEEQERLLQRQRKLIEAKMKSKPEFMHEIESLREEDSIENTLSSIGSTSEDTMSISSDSGPEFGATDSLTERSTSIPILDLSNFELFSFPEGYGKFLTPEEVDFSDNPAFVCYPVNSNPTKSSIYSIALNNRNHLKSASNEEIISILKLSSWQSMGQRIIAIKRIIDCFRSESELLDLSNLNLTSLPNNIFILLQNLKKINILGNKIMKATIPSNIEVLYSDNTSIKATRKDDVISIEKTIL